MSRSPHQLYRDDLEKSWPWIRERAGAFAARYPLLEGLEEDVASEYVERWLQQGRPPLFSWIVVDVQRKIGGRSIRPVHVEIEDETLRSGGPTAADRLEVLRLRARLNKRQSHVIDRYYFGGMPMREIAEEAGVHETRAHQIHREAIRKARAMFGIVGR